MSAQVRYFDQNGRFLRAVGGTGEGPGEFFYLRRVFPLAGDTLAVVDMRRITILGPQGEVVRTVPRPSSGIDVLGRLADGLFVGRRLDRLSHIDSAGHRRMTASILLVDDRARVVDSISGLPADDAAPEPRAGTRPVRGSFRGFRFERKAVFAVHPEGVYYGGQHEARVTDFDRTLSAIGFTATLTRPEPVTEEVKRAFEKAAADGAHNSPPDDITRGAPPPADYAPVMPAFGDIIAGRDGRLWVEDPIRPGHYPLVWTAYEEGQPVARVEIGPRFFPFEFGRDWVLGVSFDELTVERIELWKLVPGRLSGRSVAPRDAKPPIPSRCGVWTSR
jgi:hypothetical protein